jgi:hypothetical protein
MVFDMHPCGLHIYYPKKIDVQYGFVQTVADNMKLFTKQQIEGALKARHLYGTLVPSQPSADGQESLPANIAISGTGGNHVDWNASSGPGGK